MDFDQIRTLVITALFSDDQLMEKLVLKGGNAIRLVYRLSTRSSLDVDFSIEGDLLEIPEAQDRVFRALRDRFDSAGYVVFDETISAKPGTPSPDQHPSWGGYEISFKLIERDRFELLKLEPEGLRRESLVTGPNQRRTFKVDLSKHEYCEPKVRAELDYYPIFVYTPAMIAIEKLRAICQQMPEYLHRKHPATPRARDFFDIHLLVTEAGVDLAADLDLVRNIFAAKDVPLRLLANIHSSYDFHAIDWPAVVATVGQPIEGFAFYFDFVLAQVKKLEPLWVE